MLAHLLLSKTAIVVTLKNVQIGVTHKAAILTHSRLSLIHNLKTATMNVTNHQGQSLTLSTTSSRRRPISFAMCFRI